MPVFVVKDDLSLRETLASFMEKKRGHGHESPIVVVIALGFFFLFVCFFFPSERVRCAKMYLFQKAYEPGMFVCT